MQKSERPFFLVNKDWYTVPEDEGIDGLFFPDGRGYHIKEDAPRAAIESYEVFYSEPEIELPDEVKLMLNGCCDPDAAV